MPRGHADGTGQAVIGELSILAPDGVPEIHSGHDLAEVLAPLLAELRWSSGGRGVEDGDVVVVTSKVVSKAEGRSVSAADREQAITDETVRVVASVTRDGVTTRIVENRQGLVMAAAGVDASNTDCGTVLLLPEDPDRSARRLRAELAARLGRRLAVVVTDTVGRPWRTGLVDIAIGAAGLEVLDDLRGRRDSHGRALTTTVAAVADEIASAVELVTPKLSGRPVAVVRGLRSHVTTDDGPGAVALRRPAEEDLFRVGAAEAYAEGWEAAMRSLTRAGPPAWSGEGGTGSRGR